MFKNETKNRLFSIMAVFMMLAVCLTGFVGGFDADNNAANPVENDGDDFYIAAIEGTGFDYTPSVNMTSGSVVYSAATTSGISWDTNKLTGTFTANSAPTTQVLTATWTLSAGEPATTVLTQTATQNIHYKIYERMAVDTVVNNGTKSYSDSIPYGQTAAVRTVVLGGMYTAATYAIDSGYSGAKQVSIVDTTETTVNSFNVAITGNNLVVTPANGTVAAGHYQIVTKVVGTVAASSPYNAVTDACVFTFDIYVGPNVQFTGPNDVYTYIGKTDTTGTVTVNNGGTITSVTYTDNDSVMADSTVTTANFAIASSPTVDFGNSDNVTKIIGVTVNGTVADPNGEQGTINFTAATGNINVHIYKNLAFTSAPTVASSNSYAASNDLLSVLVSSNITAANSISYDWGDGTVTTKDVTKAESGLYTASHKYARGGSYLITVTATNEFGSNSSIMLYNAYQDLTFEPITVTLKDSEGATLSTFLNVYNTRVTLGDVSKVLIDADKMPENQKIEALYTDAEMTTKYNGAPLTENTTLFVKFTDMTATDNFFAEHGWIFIVFAILTVLGLIAIFYFGFQTPQVYIAVAIVAVLTILLFVYKDFGGIWDAITGLFTKN